MNFATRTRRPPKTLTADEQARILKVTGKDVGGFRDHVIISIALGCGLRESEIAGLDIEDVSADGRKLRRTIHLRVYKRSRGQLDPDAQFATLPDATYYKLEKYLRLLRADRGPAGMTGPLFMSRKGNRISVRQLRLMFRTWQQRAGFDHLYSFHKLRHTSITNIYRKTKDVRLAQRFARHAHLNTTTIYAHVSDEDLARATKDLAA